ALEVDALHAGARGVGGESDLVRRAEVEPERDGYDAGDEQEDGEERLRPPPLLLQATEIAQLGLDRGLRLLGRRRPRPGLLSWQHDLGIQRASSKPRRRSDATQAVGGLLQVEQVAAERCAGRGDDLKVFDLALADGGVRFLLQ